MSEKPRPLIQKILIDVLGFTMLLGALLFGWIPGPGGIPLLLGGLGLLSINHHWARRLIAAVKTKGSSMYDIFFPENKWLYLFYDLVGLLLATLALYLIINADTNLMRSFLIVLLFLGLGLLATNRHRITRITAWAKNKKA